MPPDISKTINRTRYFEQPATPYQCDLPDDTLQRMRYIGTGLNDNARSGIRQNRADAKNRQ